MGATGSAALQGHRVCIDALTGLNRDRLFDINDLGRTPGDLLLLIPAALPIPARHQ